MKINFKLKRRNLNCISTINNKFDNTIILYTSSIPFAQ